MNYRILWTFCVAGTITAQPLKLIDTLMVKKNTLKVTINKGFKEKYLMDDFFVEYDKDINLEQFDYSIVTLPFIMNVITLIWVSGQEYEIDEMDENVYLSLERLKEVFKIFYPATSWSGRLIPKKIVSHPCTDTSDTVAVLFSGGVDSTVTSLYHRDEKQLLISAWGQSGLPLTNKNIWHASANRIKKFAQDYGHETTFLKSNYFYFLNFPVVNNLSPEISSWRMEAIEDIGWAGLMAPIMLAKGINKLYIASSENWDMPYASSHNPYIDSNIHFMGLKFYHDLYSMSRYDKIAYLVSQYKANAIKKPNLLICNRDVHSINCGSCAKCALTLALLLSVDADPRDYGYTFSPKEALKKIKSRFRETDKYSIGTLWEYINLQKKLQGTSDHPLSWLTSVDFSRKKVCDLDENDTLLDFERLDTLFPHVKEETT